MPGSLLPELAEVEPGCYAMKAYMIHGDALFRADLVISEDGSIEMTDDEPIGQVVSAH